MFIEILQNEAFVLGVKLRWNQIEYFIYIKLLADVATQKYRIKFGQFIDDILVKVEDAAFVLAAVTGYGPLVHNCRR